MQLSNLRTVHFVELISQVLRGKGLLLVTKSKRIARVASNHTISLSFAQCCV